MTTKKIIILAATIFLSSCSALSPKAEFIPDKNELQPAYVGKPYLSKIRIIGGRVMGGWYNQTPDYKAGVVTPSDLGIAMRNCLLTDKKSDSNPKEPLYDGNCVEIYGTPIQIGIIKITIEGGMYGNMAVPASEYQKDYTLDVISN